MIAHTNLLQDNDYHYENNIDTDNDINSMRYVYIITFISYQL